MSLYCYIFYPCSFQCPQFLSQARCALQNTGVCVKVTFTLANNTINEELGSYRPVHWYVIQHTSSQMKTVASWIKVAETRGMLGESLNLLHDRLEGGSLRR